MKDTIIVKMKKHGHNNNVRKGHNNNINKEHRHSSSAMEGLGYKGQHEKKTHTQKQCKEEDENNNSTKKKHEHISNTNETWT